MQKGKCPNIENLMHSESQILTGGSIYWRLAFETILLMSSTRRVVLLPHTKIHRHQGVNGSQENTCQASDERGISLIAESTCSTISQPPHFISHI
jgi:hypothetical protein